MSFTNDELIALGYLRQRYRSEQHKSEAFTQNHLDFLKYLREHGKMEPDNILPEYADWRKVFEKELEECPLP